MHSQQAADKFGVSDRLIRRLCTQGRIVSKKTGQPAFLQGRRPEWVIPDDPRILTAKEWREQQAKRK